METADSSDTRSATSNDSSNNMSEEDDFDPASQQITKEYEQPHEKETEIQEMLDITGSHQFIAKYAVSGYILGTIIAGIYTLVGNPPVLINGLIMAIGAAAGAARGLRMRLPVDVEPEFIPATCYLLVWYSGMTLVGGFFAAIVIAAIAGVIDLIIPFSLTTDQQLTYGWAITGTILVFHLPEQGFEKYTEEYFDNWDDVFERANSIREKVAKLETDFDEMQKVHAEVRKANPHIHSTQQEAERALDSREEYLESLREWEDLAVKYEELHERAVGAATEFGQENGISGAIEGTNPETYERHRASNVRRARKSLESAEVYIDDVESLESTYKSIRQQNEEIPFDIDAIEVFTNRLNTFNFVDNKESIESLTRQAENVRDLVESWNEIDTRYQSAKEAGVKIAKRFDQTEEIVKIIEQYDPSQYEEHGEKEVEKATADIEACEAYVDKVEEVGSLHKQAKGWERNSSHELTVVTELLVEIKTIDPEFGNSEIQRLNTRTSEVRDAWEIAEQRAALQDRLAQKPLLVSNAHISELKNKLSTIDILEDPTDARVQIQRYDDVVTNIEWSLEVVDRFPSLLSTRTVRSALNRVIHSENICDDEVEEQLEEVTQLRNQANRIDSFLRKTDTDRIPIDVSGYRDKVGRAIRKCEPQLLEDIYEQVDNMEGAIWCRADLLAYTHFAFEKLIGKLYQDRGYQVEVTQAKSDYGVDVWAENDEERLAIQVKQNTDKTVGRPVLQKLSSNLIDQAGRKKADRVVVVTSSSFTKTAPEHARGYNGRMELINGEELCRLLTKSSLIPPRSTQTN